jgi:hypothetical protein
LVLSSGLRGIDARATFSSLASKAFSESSHPSLRAIWAKTVCWLADLLSLLAEAMSIPPIAICEVFIDESTQNNHAYFVMGGVIVPLTLAPAFEKSSISLSPSRASQWRDEMGQSLKGKLKAYKRLISHPFAFCPFRAFSDRVTSLKPNASRLL